MSNAKKDADGLTARQRAFAEAFAWSGNATKSAIEAGYSESCAAARGCELTRFPAVQAAIEKRFDSALRQRGIQAIKKLAELMDNAKNESARFQAAAKLAERGGAQVKPRKDEGLDAMTAEQIMKQLNEMQEEIRMLMAQVALKPKEGGEVQNNTSTKPNPLNLQH